MWVRPVSMPTTARARPENIDGVARGRGCDGRRSRSPCISAVGSVTGDQADVAAAGSELLGEGGPAVGRPSACSVRRSRSRSSTVSPSSGRAPRRAAEPAVRSRQRSRSRRRCGPRISLIESGPTAPRTRASPTSSRAAAGDHGDRRGDPGSPRGIERVLGHAAAEPVDASRERGLTGERATSHVSSPARLRDQRLDRGQRHDEVAQAERDRRDVRAAHRDHPRAVSVRRTCVTSSRCSASNARRRSAHLLQRPQWSPAAGSMHENVCCSGRPRPRSSTWALSSSANGVTTSNGDVHGGVTSASTPPKNSRLLSANGLPFSVPRAMVCTPLSAHQTLDLASRSRLRPGR